MTDSPTRPTTWGCAPSRRFLRVPANWISIIFFPLIQLLVFSQLYQDIVQLPGFGGSRATWPTWRRGRWPSPPSWRWPGRATGMLVEYRNGYLDKLRASPIGRWSILAGEMVPLFVAGGGHGRGPAAREPAAGRHPRDRRRRLPAHPGPLRRSSAIAFAGVSFIPALLTKSEQATSALSLLHVPARLHVDGLRAGRR